MGADIFMLELEASNGTKAHRTNHRVLAKLWFIIAMP
jgi:hypothetical protein